MRSSVIYCTKELFGRNYPHLASVNLEYKAVPEFIDPRFRENKPKTLVFT